MPEGAPASMVMVGPAARGDTTTRTSRRTTPHLFVIHRSQSTEAAVSRKSVERLIRPAFLVALRDTDRERTRRRCCVEAYEGRRRPSGSRRQACRLRSSVSPLRSEQRDVAPACRGLTGYRAGSRMSGHGIMPPPAVRPPCRALAGVHVIENRLQVEVIVGSEGEGMLPGAGSAGRRADLCREGWCDTARCRAAAGQHILDEGFLQGSRAWSDPSYYRCEGTVGLEQMWGAYQVPLIGDDPPRTAAWGFCSRRYPRGRGGQTLRVHHREGALRGPAEGGARSRRPVGAPQATLPAWSGRYLRQRAEAGDLVPWRSPADPDVPDAADAGVPNLGPADVSRRGEQRGAVARVVLLAEGFMRRFAQYGGVRVNLVVTQKLVLDIRSAAETLIAQTRIGRSSTREGDAAARSRRPTVVWRRDQVLGWRRR